MRFQLINDRLVENAIPLVDQWKEDAKEYFQGLIIEFLKALAGVVVDLSYSITLIGGGLLIIVWAVTGEKKAGRWFGIIFILNVVIKMLLGDIK